MRVLITGGAGFIGRSLTRQLRERGHWVRWLDNFDPQIHGAGANGNDALAVDDVIVADVRDRIAMEGAIVGMDAVVHFAAQTGTGQSMYRVQSYVDVNEGGTGVLWDVLANAKTTVRKVVVASSRSIYGEGAYQCSEHGVVVPDPRTKTQLCANLWEPVCPHCGAAMLPIATPETSVPQPASLYACTKLAQERMSLTMGRALGVSTYALRFQNVYGPGQSLRNPYTGIISIFSNQMRQNLPINIYEDGLESRDFVFVEDVADACCRAVLDESAGKCVAANVGSGCATNVIELAAILKALWQSDSTVTITGDFRVGDIRHNWADLTVLQRLWPDWRATSIEVGLAAFVAWARTQPAYADLSQAAASELKSRNL